MGRGSRCHPPSRTSRTSRIIHTPLNTPSGHRNRSAHLFFIPIHIKPQGQKPPAAHGTPPITSHNIFINPQNLRLINRKPTIATKFYSHKIYRHKISNVFLKSTSQQVYESTSQQSTSFWKLTRWGITYRSATSRFGVRFSP